METLTILYIIFGMCELITVDFDIVFVFTTSGIVGAACIILLAVFAYCYWKRGPGKKMTTNKSKIGQQQKTAQQKSKETSIKTKSASKTTTNSDQEEDGKRKINELLWYKEKEEVGGCQRRRWQVPKKEKEK